MIPLEDNTYRLVVSGIHVDTGDYWEVTFHYFVSDTAPGDHTAFTVAQELADQWVNIRQAAFLPLLPADVNLNNVSCKRVDATGGPTVTVIVGVPGEATSGCETIGNGAQICWFGDVDPILMGRTYIPGIPNDSYDDGSWDVGYRADMDTFFTAMVDDLSLFGGIADALFVIVSYQIGVESQRVANGLLRDIPGTQRRRLRR